MPESSCRRQNVHPHSRHRRGRFRTLDRAFFDHAEKKRRWNVVDGIPWDQVKHRVVDKDLVEILEAFYSVEMYLPDYSSKLIALNRQSHGMAWFLTNWCYEQVKALDGRLRSGRSAPGAGPRRTWNA